MHLPAGNCPKIKLPHFCILQFGMACRLLSGHGTFMGYMNTCEESDLSIPVRSRKFVLELGPDLELDTGMSGECRPSCQRVV